MKICARLSLIDQLTGNRQHYQETQKVAESAIRQIWKKGHQTQLKKGQKDQPETTLSQNSRHFYST